MNYLLVLTGILLLYMGGELLVRNASSLARTFRLNPSVIGLTVVAFGTSSPELAATLLSTLEGAPDVAVGNVLGSNIANIGLILGLTALVYPLTGDHAFARREVPVMIGVGLTPFSLFWDGVVTRLEGAGLLILLGGYLWYQFRQGNAGVEGEEKTVRTPTQRMLLGIGGGVLLLVMGAQALVSGAVTIAQTLGVPERVVGLTLVAVGTSLPELASSLVAAFRREPDLSLGNVVGSNVFNVLAILGLTALVYPVSVDSASARFDLGVVFGFGALLALLMWRRYRLGRAAGAVLLALYSAYALTLYL